eukprot:1608560-Prymnesium_polylepis.1
MSPAVRPWLVTTARNVGGESTRRSHEPMRSDAEPLPRTANEGRGARVSCARSRTLPCGAGGTRSARTLGA